MSSISTIWTVLVPTVSGDQVSIDFYRGDDHYVFAATVDTLDKSLMLIEQCAGDPELSLTLDDAGQIAGVMMKLLPMPEQKPDDSWLSWAIFVCGGVFLVLVLGLV